MDHYFTDNPPKNHDRREIPFRFLGVDLKLLSDHGVFSRNHIDEGSKLLIEVAHGLGLEGKLLDLGCGYGVIGLTLKKLNSQLEIIGVDINSNAIDLATRNAALNKLEATFIHQDGLEGLETFDEILFNPPIRAGKQTIYRLFLETTTHLNEQGRLLIVMRKQHGASSAIKYLNELYENVSVLTKSKGYWIIQATGVRS